MCLLYNVYKNNKEMIEEMKAGNTYTAIKKVNRNHPMVKMH